MIRSFADKRTAAIFARQYVKHVDEQLARRAHVKLIAINIAVVVGDLRNPPGNRLESLAGDRKGFWSIRVNNQWRICFRFEQGNAYDVELVDYH